MDYKAVMRSLQAECNLLFLRDYRKSPVTAMGQGKINARQIRE
jgi:hypothetical protein